MTLPITTRQPDSLVLMMPRADRPGYATLSLVCGREDCGGFTCTVEAAEAPLMAVTMGDEHRCVA
jgi:hypothetical protein